MSEPELYNQLKDRMKENASLPVEHYGRLTDLYQTIARWLGEKPWRLIIPTSLGATLLMKWFLGLEFVSLASRLQGGF